ncbi:MAG: type II toxin-antitoxin system YafQ family toxin [Ottowia sp.]|nr:type II toxin-antitoxin system YafQ family toxin [Ottowia sp.]
MRTIRQSGQFKRDLKHESKGPHRAILAEEFVGIVGALAKDQPLAEKHRDHALTGDWKDHRDCHIKPDLILIYRKHEQDDIKTLELVRLGSHSKLGL